MSYRGFIHPSVDLMGFGCCKVRASAGFTIYSPHHMHHEKQRKRKGSANAKQAGGRGLDRGP